MQSVLTTATIDYVATQLWLLGKLPHHMRLILEHDRAIQGVQCGEILHNYGPIRLLIF